MKKGQTALEYLMTYGWAILIVIVVVAALYALGLTKPCRWTGTGINGVPATVAQMSGVKFDSNQNLTFSLKAQGTDNVGITQVNMTYANGRGYAIAANGQANLNPGVVLSPQAQPSQIIARGTGATGWNSGDCFTVDVFIQYNLSSDTTATNHSMTPRITGTIEAP